MPVIKKLLQQSGSVGLAVTLMLFASAPAHAASVASLSSPPDAATNVDPLTTFSWDSVSNALAYFVYVGSAKGLSDVYGSGEITATTVTVRLQPQTHYFVRLWTKESSGWFFTDTTFSTGTGIARLISPKDGATNVDPVSRLSWSSVTDAQAYFVYVGSAPGLMDVYGSGEIPSTSVAVPNLQPNTRYFVRMWTKKKEGWYFADTTFSTGSGIARLITPQDGALNVDPFSKLTWNTVVDAQAYFVYVGSAQGLADVYGSGEITATSVAVSNLQPATHYFVRDRKST